MKHSIQSVTSIAAICLFALIVLALFSMRPAFEKPVAAQEQTSPTPVPVFDQAQALANLREQIKGREKEPAESVFKNIQNFKGVPAGRILAIMEMGYSRSLGVNCTHCHTPGEWAAETKPTKQIAREMQTMSGKINGELLAGIKGIAGRNAVINCTTCHRGELKPATNLGSRQ